MCHLLRENPEMAKGKQSIPKFYMKSLVAQSDKEERLHKYHIEKRKRYFEQQQKRKETYKHP